MAVVSQNTKYVKLDDGVSFALVRTNPKLTTNTKLMYNGKKMYMESYASSELMNRSTYKNVSVKPNGRYNSDIANFLSGSGSQAYNVYQNFSNITISDSYDNQFETLYWCGAEYIDSSFYDEEIGFVAPLYLREKLPNYFLIFRIDTPSNYNLTVDENGKVLDSTFDFKADILDKAVLIKTFDLREGSVLGNYIHNYVEQDEFEFDKSMYVNFSNGEVTYYGIDRVSGVLEKRVENFENELLKNDNPVLSDDKWFTEGFERNDLIFPYIINIEYLFNDDNFIVNGKETYDFGRYIGVYCNTIEFGEFADLDELRNSGCTKDNAIYYFEDNKNNLHRYTITTNNEDSDSDDNYDLKIDGKDNEEFNKTLISGFEKDRVTGYAEPLDIYEGFINRAQYGFEILKPFEPGDWVGIEFEDYVECYFADDKNVNNGETYDMKIGEYSDFRFSVNEESTVNDIAKALVNSVNSNKKSKFEARYSDNAVVFYAKRDGKKYNGIEGGAKMLMEASLIYNRKISLPISNYLEYVNANDRPIEDISDTDGIVPVINSIIDGSDSDDIQINCEKSSFGNYYTDYFCGACNSEIDPRTDTYKNIFKIYNEEYVFFSIDRYLKTNNGDGRRICSNMMYINADGKIDPDYRLVIIDDAPNGKRGNKGYDVSVSSTYQVEIMDKFKPNHGVLSWFPVRDFDFDINYSTYGQYRAFFDECVNLGNKKVNYVQDHHTTDTYADSDDISTYEYTVEGMKELAKSPFFDDYGNSLFTEYDYYNEQIYPKLCLVSKTVPFISKWGYYDEQKDSCENPYRLNVNKVFGISNLSANTYLRSCDEDNYTHSLPYYMILGKPDYLKDYQYIQTDEIYEKHHIVKTTQDENGIDVESQTFNYFYDCVDYWIKVFMNTDEDMFSHFFSGKKYGKRFDKKYSRLLGGDKFHNPSTLFRGVKFEAVRQYNGMNKRTNEYNDYKFSFIYIPVLLDSIIFDSTIHFVKNDTFKFIVGIIFVNTMLGTFDHSIFQKNKEISNGDSNETIDVDYFNKCFIYSACKDIVRPENTNPYNYDLTIKYAYYDGSDSDSDVDVKTVEDSYNDIWKKNYRLDVEKNIFYMWYCDYTETVFVTKTKDVTKEDDIIGEYNIKKGIENIDVLQTKFNYIDVIKSGEEFKIIYTKYYSNYDVTIHGYNTFKYFGEVLCEIDVPYIEFKDYAILDICNIEWEYFSEENGFSEGYKFDVSKLDFKSESIQNILINLGKDCVKSIRIYNTDGSGGENNIKNGEFENKSNCEIIVDINSGSITIKKIEGVKLNTIIVNRGNNFEDIKNVMIDIIIDDKFDEGYDSLALKDYFSCFNQISAYNITKYLNDDYNVKYYSTVEENKYKIRVVEPDCIEIEDRYEAIPTIVTQNNKRVIGTIDIKEKMDVDKIGVKVINRYSGFYNPIFNDILYFDDYKYSKTVGRLKNAVNFEMPYSNTYIDYEYIDEYGEFGVIKNMYFHKTNVNRSNNILTSVNPVYPIINEYALDYRDYNIFSSNWDEGYFISQDDLDNSSVCEGIGSMKEGLCMFGSKYLNIPDYIFIDTFENGKLWDEKITMDIRDNTDTEIIYKEINDRTVIYNLMLKKRLKRYLKELLNDVFSKYINKKYSFGNKGTIEDDIDEYIEKNLLKLYKVDKVNMYIKDDRMGISNRLIENDYLKYIGDSNELKIKQGFPSVSVAGGVKIKESNFTMNKGDNEFDRTITYNLKTGFKESFGFGVSFKRK